MKVLTSDCIADHALLSCSLNVAPGTVTAPPALWKQMEIRKIKMLRIYIKNPVLPRTFKRQDWQQTVIYSFDRVSTLFQ